MGGRCQAGDISVPDRSRCWQRPHVRSSSTPVNACVLERANPRKRYFQKTSGRILYTRGRNINKERRPFQTVHCFAAKTRITRGSNDEKRQKEGGYSTVSIMRQLRPSLRILPRIGRIRCIPSTLERMVSLNASLKCTSNVPKPPQQAHK